MLPLIAAGGSIDFQSIFLDLGIILVVAKLAAELAERARIPAVLGEITAGILIGPSALGLVGSTDATKILAEIGVIVLLATVGMETDLNELRRVGRASMIVAVIGVVAPMSTGIFAGRLLGESTNASLFLGAALAATSVGITARVFGDLHALSSTEARIVLGAAVADDVLGLIILTVVTRVVEQGSVDVAGVAGTIGLAVGFLVIATAVGLAVLPRMFAAIGSRSRSTATVGVIAAGLTFAFSAAASSANLAPIIGAFVAGTALGRTKHHDRIARDFTSLGNVFIPVFFLQIGIDTEVGKFFQTHVLWVAAVLSVVAVAGKMVAGLGAIGTNSDRILIGMGMVPRGEVGLIFASIGVTVGVFGEDLYAVVLLVVLVTTVIAPPLLRWRLQQSDQGAAKPADSTTSDRPADDWIQQRGNSAVLVGTPPSALTLAIALDAATHAASLQPDGTLMDWLHEHRLLPLSWDAGTTETFVHLLMNGNARSWRLLEITNVLDRALPEFAHALDSRRSDSSELDPTHVSRLATLESVRERTRTVSIDDCSLVLAAFLVDISTDNNDSTLLLDRLTISTDTRRDTLALLSASTLVGAAITAEPYEHNPRVMAQLAEYLGSPAMVERCRILVEARNEIVDWQYSILLEITTGVQELLAHPELLEGVENSLESIKRRDALALAPNALVRDRISHASAGYVIAHDPETIVRHATLVEPAPRGRTVRVNVIDTGRRNEWLIDIATRDARGLLARMTKVLADRGLDIVNADLATWPDGAVLDTFTVRSVERPNPQTISFDLERSLRTRVSAPRRLQIGPGNGLTIRLDNDAHPWHSVVVISGADQPGLLQAVAAAFARANVSVHHARISTEGGVITDRFEVSDRHGRKITASTMSRVESLLS
ncbi:MAG: High-affinity Na(+)/H(+) antiporter NhaS3 [Actinomycetota bacterium]|jgi:Kef-type K+ transport system membrane component KefB/predicted amino acid-binding ACT domain protein